ncbi:PilW family protein, partial [Desulfobulbus sp. TB]|nr:PilW family protein [Desulfobulbus sp. TB]
ALDFIVRDLRMAGFDIEKCTSGLLTKAETEELEFETCDASDTKVKVRYFFDDAYTSNGMNNGILDDLFREVDGGTDQLIIEGLDALEFRYLDNEGEPLSSPVNTQAIRAIQISALIRANFPDPRYTDTTYYQPASGNANWKIKSSPTANPPNDNFHRRLLVTTVKLRNLGL